MEEVGSLWSPQESIEELKQRLLLTTYELETTRNEAVEEMRKSKENVKQLLNLLMIAYQERDEARDQLQKLLNKVVIPTSPNDCCFTMFPHENPLIKPIKANSSITESNSLSSPEFSNIDAVSSPELSNINLGDLNNIGYVTHQTLGQEFIATTSTRTFDHGTIVIDNLVRGKTLPQKGRLLQAVMEAGPLLQTLMVAGPLPRWRNPPPLQSFHIPPVGIKGCETTTLVDQEPVANFANVVVPKTDSSFGLWQTCSSSMLNFMSGGSSSNSDVRIIISYSMPDGPLPSGSYKQPSWNPYVISSVATVCVVFLRLSHYKLLKRHFYALCGLCGFISSGANNRRFLHREANHHDLSLLFQSKGLDCAIIESIPTSQFTKKDGVEMSPRNTGCAVCLGEFEEGERLKFSAKLHSFIPFILHCYLVQIALDLTNVQSDNAVHPEHPESMFPILETLRREDFFRGRAAHYQILRAQIIQNSNVRWNSSNEV
ncbi:Protein of unknown function DUF1635 [Dillenia turbinata]|uniref:Uncharacterized protein n=1 Tax=Dillenia turbinata TaxID=194707 RepID=A0AAN8VQA6_9MAGN